jgi:hypothetical protein
LPVDTLAGATDKVTLHLIATEGAELTSTDACKRIPEVRK